MKTSVLSLSLSLSVPLTDPQSSASKSAVYLPTLMLCFAIKTRLDRPPTNNQSALILASERRASPSEAPQRAQMAIKPNSDRPLRRRRHVECVGACLTFATVSSSTRTFCTAPPAM